MWIKIIYAIIGGVFLLALGFIVGLIFGATIGGNFFTSFECFGVRGYEATGILGSIIGGAIGALSGVFLGVKFGAWRDKIG